MDTLVATARENLQIILDIGEQMLSSGAEIGRVEDSIERMCRND